MKHSSIRSINHTLRLAAIAFMALFLITLTTDAQAEGKAPAGEGIPAIQQMIPVEEALQHGADKTVIKEKLLKIEESRGAHRDNQPEPPVPVPPDVEHPAHPLPPEEAPEDVPQAPEETPAADHIPDHPDEQAIEHRNEHADEHGTEHPIGQPEDQDTDQGTSQDPDQEDDQETDQGTEHPTGQSDDHAAEQGLDHRNDRPGDHEVNLPTIQEREQDRPEVDLEKLKTHLINETERKAEQLRTLVADVKEKATAFIERVPDEEAKAELKEELEGLVSETNEKISTSLTAITESIQNAGSVEELAQLRGKVRSDMSHLLSELRPKIGALYAKIREFFSPGDRRRTDLPQ